MGEASAHRSIGDDLDAAEGFELAHPLEEMPLRSGVEDEAAVHDARDAVVESVAAGLEESVAGQGGRGG